MLGVVDRYLETRFGGKKPFLLFLQSLALYGFGRFRPYREIDFPRVERLIFICRGNICRSPYAEAKSRQLVNLPVISAGLDTSLGCPADTQALKVGRNRGVDLSAHRSMPLGSVDVRQSDLLIVMEPAQAEFIARNYPAINAQVALLGLWCLVPAPFIQDPYGRCDLYFDRCFERMDSALRRLSTLL